MGLIVCCGDDRLFVDSQLDNRKLGTYGCTRDNGAFHFIYFEEEEVFGAKQIISICLGVLTLIGIVVGAVYYYKKKKMKKSGTDRELSMTNVVVSNGKPAGQKTAVNDNSIDDTDAYVFTTTGGN